MNQDDRAQFEEMKQDVRFIKDTLVIALENHLKHIEAYSEETRDMTEQAFGMAQGAEKAAKETRRFVVAGIAFLGLIMAIIQCLG